MKKNKERKGDRQCDGLDELTREEKFEKEERMINEINIVLKENKSIVENVYRFVMRLIL